VTQFLVVYDRRAGSVIRFSDFSDMTGALEARWAEEREHRGEPDIEIVVLSASSEEQLRSTHSRYFKSAAELSSF